MRKEFLGNTPHSLDDKAGNAGDRQSTSPKQLVMWTDCLWLGIP